MFLKKGMHNENIRRLQRRLLELGYDVRAIDGAFGPRTERAVMAFQRERRLSVDGIVGNETWGALFEESPPVAVETLDGPPPYSQCFEIFDDFRLAGWQEQYLVRCDLSAYEDDLRHLYFGWLDQDDKAFVHSNWFGFVCHRLVAPRFQAAFGKIVERNLHASLKTFDGCFSPRFMRGSDTWSTHSWAIAIDLDARWNRFGQTTFQMSEEVAQCFEQEGFIWGGRWQGRPDAMHFQYCTVR
jgi:hypothetical protein